MEHGAKSSVYAPPVRSSLALGHEVRGLIYGPCRTRHRNLIVLPMGRDLSSDPFFGKGLAQGLDYVELRAGSFRMTKVKKVS